MLNQVETIAEDSGLQLLRPFALPHRLSLSLYSRLHIFVFGARSSGGRQRCGNRDGMNDQTK